MSVDRFPVTPNPVEFWIDAGEAATATNIGSSTVYGGRDTMFPTLAAAQWTLAAGASRTVTSGAIWIRTADGTSSALTVVVLETSITTIPTNTQSASYTLGLSDASGAVEMNLGTPTVITIPTNDTVAFPVGTVIELARVGTGTVTITPAGGVIIPNRVQAAGTASRTLISQYSSASIRQREVNVWMLTGDIA